MASSRRANPASAPRCVSMAPRPEVLQQVIVQVDAIERGVGGTRLVQIAEVVVDEVAEWFRGVHVERSCPHPPSCGHLPRLQ